MEYDARVMQWLNQQSKRIVVAVALAGFFVPLPEAISQGFALKDGASVVLYGDSITAQRFYTRFAEEFVLTRYPRLHIRFANAGVPGDTVYGGYAGDAAQRVQRDVQPFHPAMITVMLGMNDGGYGYTPEPTVHENFIMGYGALLKKLREAAPDAALTLMNPTPYDEVTHGSEFPGYAKIVDRVSEDVTKIASAEALDKQRQVLRVDLHAAVSSALVLAANRFPALAPLLIPDRIHPAEAAHWIMAAALMKGWQIDPVVSSVVLDAKSGRVKDAQRTTVTKMSATAANLAWTQLDEALPLPLDLNNAMTPVILGVSDVTQLDREMLRLDSLDAGRYELRIDGKVMAGLSSEELRQGVNLALLKTPMWEQARSIDFLEERRGELEQARFVLAEELKPKETSAAADARLRDAQDELDAAVRSKLELKEHHFELRRVKE